MKRALPFALAVALIAPHASAAPKAITPTLGSIFNAPVGTEGLVLSGKNTIFFSNINQATSDIEVTALDAARNQVWRRTIDSGADEVAMSAAVDSNGNIWLAGAAALPRLIETPTSLNGIDNPDNISLETISEVRPDMTELGLWKVSPTGDVLASYSLSMPTVPVISALAVNASGISLIGGIDSKPFLVTSSLTGVFSKPIYIGSSKTEFNSVARFNDGSVTIFGSSAETLAGKKVAGVRDGVLIKVSKAGAITSLLRSSAKKASRTWLSGDTFHLASGTVITGSTIETAITKFSPTFAPTWTMRVPSSGASLSLTANGNSYLAFASRGAISGVPSWKPTKPSLLVLTFDSKGALKAATALPGLVSPLSLHYSPVSGVTGLATGSDGTVSIFTLVSR